MSSVVPLDSSAAVWRGPIRNSRPLVVFLHGYGGNEEDWSGHFDLVPADFDTVSLRGPVALRDRWTWVDFHRQGITEFSAAGRGVLDWLEGLGSRKVALVGWSLGAAMAIQLARLAPERFAAIAMQGGFIWVRTPLGALRQRDLPAFYGIGTDDDVIPKQSVPAARRFLDAHARPTYRLYDGVGHDLTREMAEDAVSFVARQLGA